MKFEIQYQEKYDNIEDIATKSEFKIVEPAPGGGFNESHFMNGKGLFEYIDRSKVLRDEEHPFPFVWSFIVSKLSYLFPNHIGV